MICKKSSLMRMVRVGLDFFAFDCSITCLIRTIALQRLRSSINRLPIFEVFRASFGATGHSFKHRRWLPSNVEYQPLSNFRYHAVPLACRFQFRAMVEKSPGCPQSPPGTKMLSQQVFLFVPARGPPWVATRPSGVFNLVQRIRGAQHDEFNAGT